MYMLSPMQEASYVLPLPLDLSPEQSFTGGHDQQCVPGKRPMPHFEHITYSQMQIAGWLSDVFRADG